MIFHYVVFLIEVTINNVEQIYVLICHTYVFLMDCLKICLFYFKCLDQCFSNIVFSSMIFFSFPDE